MLQQTVDAPAEPAAPARRFRRRSGQTTETHDLHVSVRHASLEHATNILIVGHYRGAEISGAEASLDVRLQGRLSTQQVARLYPEEIGESELFDNRVRRDGTGGGTGYPDEAIVVGLGAPGELTRTRLTDTVVSALLRRALHEATAASGDETVALALSPMLIGTRGPTPVRIDLAVGAIVDAVLAANHRLRELSDRRGRRLDERVRFTAIEFVELHLDRAELAAHAVLQLERLVTAPSGNLRLVPHPYLREGGGGWPARLAMDEDPGWHRIVIEAKDRTAPEEPLRLQFTSVGSRALSEVLEIQPNLPIVETLLRSVTSSSSQHLAPSLFDALVPTQLRDELVAADNVQLIVDAVSARYPWEAIIVGHEANNALPASRRGGMIRQFVDTEGHRGRARATEGRHALVIGNPPTDHAPLPAAADEAVRVSQQLLGREYAVTHLVWRDGNPVDIEVPDGAENDDVDVDQLDPAPAIFVAIGRPHRILHVAAHGIAGSEADAGIVIGPNGVRLRASDVDELAHVPELVVLNCCDLGADPGLPANLARAFMKRGAQAVIAAAWPVSDAAAERFATEFYGRMLNGASFGTAAQAARSAAYEADPKSMTWAAYQCYGDPGYRIEEPVGGGRETPQRVSESEFVRLIEIAIVRAGDVGRAGDAGPASGRKAALASLRALVDSVQQEGSFPLRAFGRARLAFAFSELGDYGEAVQHYLTAIGEENAIFPMSALEQLGNVEVRHAQRRFRDGALEEAATLTDSSLRHLLAARYVGKTGERYFLLGGHFKKRATMSEGLARTLAVRRSAYFYARANEHAPSMSHRLIWIQLDELGAKERPADVQPPATWEDVADAQDFWSRAARADWLVTRLVTGDDSVDVDEIRSTYEAAFDVRSSWRERSSVLDHLRDLATICDDPKLASRLGEVRDGLLAWVERRVGSTD